jgi:NAD(P)-dependent dehydrogenase (short-subunit alcohol dehydrogenase family)
MRIHVEGKVALVTGGSRGIGLAAAKALAEAGARVVIASRKPENLEQARVALEADGVKVDVVASNVGKEGAAAELVKAVVEKCGKLDVLVNNAATNPHFGPIVSADDKVFDKTFETNARGYFSLARETAKHLIDRGAPGSLIFISSTQGLIGSPLMGVYGMTKAATISLAQTLAVELGPSGIRSNAVAPGLVETRFAGALTSNDEIMKRYLERTPLRRVGRPEDIAGAILFLASDASAYLTGQTIVVDGGFTIST